MKPLRVFLPAIAASLLLIGLFAWVNQSALARALQPDDLPIFDAWQASSPNMPQSNSVITKVLPTGDKYIHGLIYSNGFLYASTRTYPDPTRILMIDPTTLGVVATQTLPSKYYDGEDIVAAGGYLWVILFTEPARLIRLDPTNLNLMGTLIFSETAQTTMGAGESMTYAFGYLWAGGRNHLARVDISQPLTPTYNLYDFSSLNLASPGAGLFGSLAHDGQYLWATYKQYTGTQGSGYFYASTVLKINPLNPTGTITKTEISVDTPDDNLYTAGSYFVGEESEPVQTTPSDLYKFKGSNPAIYTATHAASTASFGLFGDPNQPQSVWGAFVGLPGIVKKFDLNAAPVMTVTLPSGFNDPSEIAFDPSGNVYITTWQSPARIVKLTPQYLTSDLRISSSHLPDPVYAGNSITYTLTVTNDGPVDASGVLVTDTLPAQLSFLTSTPGSPQCSFTGGKLACAIGNLGPQSSKQVIISAQVSALASGSITNTAQVTSSSTDPNLANNMAQDKTVVKPAEADLAIGLAASSNPVPAGQLLTYTLAITNSGPSSVAAFVVTDTLPSQVSFVSSSPTSPACMDSAGQVICHLGSLSASASRKIAILARVDDLATGMIANTAKVSSSISDPALQNNTRSIQTTVIDSADLKVQISADKTSVAFGDTLVYSITLDNLGPTRAFTASLQDVLPVGVDFISSSPGTISCMDQNGVVTCVLGTIQPHVNLSLQFLVRVNHTPATNLHNSVSVDALTPDPDSSNNTASTDTEVFHRLYLPVLK